MPPANNLLPGSNNGLANTVSEQRRNRRLIGNALISPVERAAQDLFGLEPGLDRLSLLPRYSRDEGLIAPQVLYELAKAAVAPGVAAQGYEVMPEEAVNFAGNLVGTGVGARMAAPAAAGDIGMVTYHGSPHLFDRFDLSKVGTGQGAQTYGHGIYIAQTPETGFTYKHMAPDRIRVGDQEITGKLGVEGRNDPVTRAWNEVTAAYQGQHENPFAVAKQRLQGKYGPSSDVERKALQVINDWQSKGATIEPGGYLYTVDLPDQHIANMLDWDKPLSEQPESVQTALANSQLLDRETAPKLKRGTLAALKRGEPVEQRTALGRDIYTRAKTKTGSAAAASEYLRSLGIPGIRYYDGNSRAAGEGTRNFVIFDPSIATIIKRE